VTGPITVEVDIGSATSWGRTASHWYMVRIRRGEECAIVAYGLTREHAGMLAERLAKILA